MPGNALSAPGNALSALGNALSAPGDALSAPGNVLSAPGTSVCMPSETLSAFGVALSAPGDAKSDENNQSGNGPGYTAKDENRETAISPVEEKMKLPETVESTYNIMALIATEPELITYAEVELLQRCVSEVIGERNELRTMVGNLTLADQEHLQTVNELRKLNKERGELLEQAELQLSQLSKGPHMRVTAYEKTIALQKLQLSQANAEIEKLRLELGNKTEHIVARDLKGNDFRSNMANTHMDTAEVAQEAIRSEQHRNFVNISLNESKT